MVFPRYYVQAEPVKLLQIGMYFVCGATMIIQAVYRAYLYKFPITNPRFFANWIPYFASLPTWLQLQADIGNFDIFPWLFMSGFSGVIYILCTLIFIGGAKRRLTLIWVGIQGIFATAHFIRLIKSLIAVFYARVGTPTFDLIFTVDPANPTNPSSINPDFTSLLVLDIILFFIGLVMIIANCVLFIMTDKVLKQEFKKGAIPTHRQNDDGNLSDRLDITCCLPSFYASSDSVFISMIPIYFLGLVAFAAWLVQDLYNYTFIWTNQNIPYAPILYYNAMGLDYAYQVVFGSIYWLFFYFTHFSIYFCVAIPLIAIAGHKRQYTYPIMQMGIVFYIVINFVTICFWIVTWFDSRNFAWAINNILPLDIDSKNPDFTIMIVCEIVLLICAALQILAIESLRFPTDKLVVDERENGVIQTSGAVKEGILNSSHWDSDENVFQKLN